MRIKMILKKESYSMNEDSIHASMLKMDDCSISTFAEIFLDGFIGTVDYEGESLKDTITYIEQIKSGIYGEILSDYSGLLLQNATPVSGIIMTLFEEVPLIVSVFTKNEYKKKGFGEILLRSVIEGIFKNTQYSEIILYVSENNPAISIYHKIGFKVFDEI